ncbi:MAG TPA: hypothetical protein VFO86_09955 [Terriglobia bacterium]|nr:hypothetical protein [Terriglobia bacterium]
MTIAKGFLNLMKQSSEEDVVAQVDNFLVYFRGLRDQFDIVKSKSPRFSGRNFHFLADLIADLESDPEGTLRSADYRAFITNLLDDISSGRLEIVRKNLP